MEERVEQAVKIIEQALNLASLKGVFNLQDSSVVNQALELLKSQFVHEPVKEEVNSHDKAE